MANGWTWLTNAIQATGATTTGAWTDLDLSSIVKAGSKQVAIFMINTHATTGYVARVRPNGTSDDFKATLSATRMNQYIVRLDSSYNIEYYLENTAVQIWVQGYSDVGHSFLNSTLKSDGWNSWTDSDVSAICPAGSVGVLIDLSGTSNGSMMRRNGSVWSSRDTDGGPTGGVSGLYINLDSNRVFEYFRSNLSCRVVGYCRTEIVLLPDPILINPTRDGTFRDVDISSYIVAGDKATGVLCWSEGYWSRGKVCIRNNGSTDDFYLNSLGSGFGGRFCGVTSSIFEAAVQSIYDNLWLVGYTRDFPSPFVSNRMNA